MKQQILLGVAIILTAISLFAQTPQSFKYQAVARDLSGMAIENQTISMRILLLQTSASGTVVYSETHTVITSEFGLFVLTIGNGTVVSGDFTTIDWGNDQYFMRVEMDPTGGTTYQNMGTTQLLSVPYALYAESANSVANDQIDDADADPTNEIQTLSSIGNQLTISGGNTVALTDNVDDADADPANEIQTLSNTGNQLTISGGNTVILTDNVNDADADPGNELQTLSVNGSNLSISNGNTVTLPSGGGTSLWTQSGSDIYYNSGNVGIGNTNPLSKLNIKDNTGSTSSGQIMASVACQISGTDGYNYGIEGLSDGTSAGNNYGIIGFAENANTNIGIIGQSSVANNNTNGYNVGTSGLANSSIFSNIGVEAGAAFGNTSTGTNVGISSYATSTTSGTNYGIYSRASNGGTNYAGYFDGDVTVTGTFTNPSDKKLKTDINSITGALNIISNMNPVTYRYEKNEVMNLPENMQYGLIAQELEQILPELVTNQVMNPKATSAQAKNKNLVDKYEYKGINYMGIIPVLVQGIKEQQEMIKAQNARIEELEKIIKK